MKSLAATAAVAFIGLCFISSVQSQDLQCQVLDIVFVIDRSGSIRDSNPAGCSPTDNHDDLCDNWLLMRNFINDLIDAITPTEDTRFGAVVFGNDDSASSLVVFDLTNDRASAKQQIMALPHENQFTATYRGLRIMREDVFTKANDRPGVPNVAIVITDGEPTLWEGGTQDTSDVDLATTDAFKEAKAAQNEGIIILSIGVTNQVTESVIIGLSSNGLTSNVPVLDETYYISEDFSDLITLVSGLETITCKYSSAPTEDCTQSIIADVVFVIDSSGSIEDTSGNNWNLVLQFVSDIVEELPVSSTANRIAVVEFGNNGILIFDFNFSFDKQTIQNKTLAIPFLGENTNTSGGFYVILSDLLNEESGHRAAAENYVVLITDGVSNTDSELTIPYAEELHAAGVTVLVVGIGITEDIDVNEIRDISSPPRILNETYFLAPDFNDLTPIVDQIVSATCTIIETIPFSAIPNFGPQAGGTNITIRYSFVVSSVQGGAVFADIEVQLDETLLNHTLIDKNTIIASTPERYDIDLKNDDVSVPFRVLVDGDVVNNAEFSYKPNPIIEDVFPLKSIRAGGTFITVTGQYLDSVAQPKLVIIAISYIGQTTSREVQEWTSPCNVSSAMTMTCIVPVIPELNSNRRRRRQINEDIIALLYIGFILDGFNEFRNLTEKLPNKAMITMYVNPVIPRVNDVIRHRGGDRLVIKGSKLDLGVSKGDYQILIEETMCPELELLSNRVSCKPPRDEPPIIKRGDYENGKLRVTVIVAAHLTYRVGKMQYIDDISKDATSPLIITIIVVVVAVVISMIIALACLLRCIANNPNHKQQKDKNDNNGTDLEIDDAVLDGLATAALPELKNHKDDNVEGVQ